MGPIFIVQIVGDKPSKSPTSFELPFPHRRGRWWTVGERSPCITCWRNHRETHFCSSSVNSALPILITYEPLPLPLLPQQLNNVGEYYMLVAFIFCTRFQNDDGLGLRRANYDSWRTRKDMDLLSFLFYYNKVFPFFIWKHLLNNLKTTVFR